MASVRRDPWKDVTGSVPAAASAAIAVSEDAEEQDQNAIGSHYYRYYRPYYYWWGWGWGGWWWWWPYWYYYNGKVDVSARFKQTTRLRFERAVTTNAAGASVAGSGRSIDAACSRGGGSGGVQLRTVTDDDGDRYSAMWDVDTKEYLCDHFVDAEVVRAWLENEKHEGDRKKLCPQCDHDRERQKKKKERGADR